MKAYRVELHSHSSKSRIAIVLIGCVNVDLWTLKGKVGMGQKRMASHVECLQKADLQTGDPQDFVKPLVLTLAVLLIQDMISAPSLTTDFQNALAATAVVQLLSHVRFFVTPWTAAHQASPSLTISWSLLKLMSIDLVMPSNHLVLCCPLLLPSIFPIIRIFSSESALASGGQNIGASASASVLPMNIQG